MQLYIKVDLLLSVVRQDVHYYTSLWFNSGHIYLSKVLFQYTYQWIDPGQKTQMLKDYVWPHWLRATSYIAHGGS